MSCVASVWKGQSSWNTPENLCFCVYEHPKIVCGGGGGGGALDILQALGDIYSADVTTPNMLSTFPYHSDSDRDGLHI